jgi:hypothetical protein
MFQLKIPQNNSMFMETSFLSIKGLLGSIGGFMLITGSQIEPSVGVWVISLGGALLHSTFGKDYRMITVFSHIVIGLFCGIFGSQIVHAVSPIINQIAAAFFMSLIGVEMVLFAVRNFQVSTFTGVIQVIFQAFFENLTTLFKKKD